MTRGRRLLHHLLQQESRLNDFYLNFLLSVNMLPVGLRIGYFLLAFADISEKYTASTFRTGFVEMDEKWRRKRI
jgi:hypothetical protein